MKPTLTVMFAAVAVMVVSCGSQSREKLIPTDTDFVSCLSAHRPEFSRASGKDADYIAQGASAYSMVTTAGGNHVNVSIWKSTSKAKDALTTYESLPGAGHAYRKANVVIAWDETPSEFEKTTLEGCLGFSH